MKWVESGFTYGLCHKCFTSNIEVKILGNGDVCLCQKCENK